jgi:hypothetical protein
MADVFSAALLQGNTTDSTVAEPAAGADTRGREADVAVLRRITPTVHVTVPVLALLGHGDEPAMLEGYGPIDVETARLLTANAPSLTRLLTHPETGQCSPSDATTTGCRRHCGPGCECGMVPAGSRAAIGAPERATSITRTIGTSTA